jgi:hypothetical protein
LNKKQKILTMAALSVFSAIIFFHYGSIGIYYSAAHEKTYLIPTVGAAKQQGDIFDQLVPPDKPPKKRISADEFNKIPYEARANAIKVPNEWVIVEFPRIGPYPFLGNAPIKDVRMPLFVLAVFYVGLFFILRDATPGK